MLRVCVKKINVTENFKKFLILGKLNNALSVTASTRFVSCNLVRQVGAIW